MGYGSCGGPQHHTPRLPQILPAFPQHHQRFAHSCVTHPPLRAWARSVDNMPTSKETLGMPAMVAGDLGELRRDPPFPGHDAPRAYGSAHENLFAEVVGGQP